MKLLTTILLSLLAAFLVTSAVFLTVDGNLARITGWYRFEPGRPLFSEASMGHIQDVTWMRIEDLHDRIECERDAQGVWWITAPFRDRMSQEAAATLLTFTANAKLVDTLPLNNTVKGSMREFGVESSPHTITLKVPVDEEHHTTVARYTLGSTAPWLADAGDGKNLIRTTYLRTDFYSSDKRIHVVTGNILELFRNGLPALRDPHPLLFSPDDVRAITISKINDTRVKPLKANRLSAESQWTLVQPIITAANQDKLNNLVLSLSKLKALRVDNASGIKLPDQAEWSIELDIDGKGKQELLLYPSFAAEADAQQVCYAKVNDRPVVFTLEAEPRVRRRGCYSAIINETCKVPVLPEKTLAQLLSGSGVVYTNELPLQLDELRSKQFADIKNDDVYRVLLMSHFSRYPVSLIHIPGDKDSGVRDTWLYSAEGKRFAEAEQDYVKAFLRGLSEIPVTNIVEDIPLGGDRRSILQRYGLTTPDYTLAILPNPCALRATLYGLDLPLIKDRGTRTFFISRTKDPESGRSCWVGMEKGGYTISRLSTKLTRMFSLQDVRWKNRSLFNFPISALRRLTLGFQKEPLELEYDYIGESWTGKINNVDVTPRINPHRAVFYVRQLQKLRVDQWLSAGDVDALTALADPVFSVKLDLELTDYSDAEAVVIDDAGDVSVSQTGNVMIATPDGAGQMSENEVAQEMLKEDSATDQAMRDLAFAERPTIKKTLTLEIALSDDPSDEPFFYGRIRETGELFILNYHTAQSLAASILDM